MFLSWFPSENIFGLYCVKLSLKNFPNPQCIRFRKKVHSGHSQITKIQYSLQILHKIVYSKSLLKNWYTLRISRKIIFYAQNSKSAAHWAGLFCSSLFGPCTFKAGSFLAELFWCRDQLRSYFLNIYFNSYYRC